MSAKVIDLLTSGALNPDTKSESETSIKTNALSISNILKSQISQMCTSCTPTISTTSTILIEGMFGICQIIIKERLAPLMIIRHMKEACEKIGDRNS